ncbi:MAG: UvrD-helicase domain-containing protein [Elusimicrobiota bacterium]
MDPILDKLNPAQRDAMLHTEGPLIIFAGAGTGKTRVITHRIAYLLSQDVKPWNVLAVTFTNKAAEEMRRRVDALAPGQGRSVWISTFHSFGAKFLRVEAKHLGIDPSFLIYDDADQKNLLRDCVRELNLDEKKFKPSRLIEIISRAKDELLDADSYGIHSLASGDHFRQVVATIYGLYQKKIERSGALDFGDLLMLSVTALRENETLREKYQERFKYLLIDEYQDTNHAQYMLTKYLAGKYKNICVVGDDDQSIYSWRGADIRNILEFERDYPGCRMVKLEQNYRSTKNILDSAWNVIKNNQDRVEKKLWTESESGEKIKSFESLNELEEAQRVTDEITRGLETGSRRNSDYAVFYRTNAQSRVLEDAMRRNGLPYAIVGTVRFYDRAEVKDIMAYMRLVHNPNDSVSLKRVVNVPHRGIGKTSMEVLGKYATEKGISLWEAVKNLHAADVPTGAKRGLAEFRKIIDETRENKDATTVKKIAMEILERTGYIKELETEDTTEARSRIENLQELISAIDEFETRSPDKTLAGYLTQVALVSDLDSWSDDNDKVTLMTLHLAKGLEFRTVFITGLEEGLFPIGEAAFDREELEEERRLMYVGMTRAKENLFLSWAAERKIFGKSRWNMRSRFMEEAKPVREEGITREQVYDGSRAVMEDYGGGDFPLGCKVKHQKFGEGKVIERSGSGDELKLVVLFDTGQWKKLLVRMANLEKI